MLTEICQYLRNWFCKSKFFGDFEIEDGNIKLQFDSGAEFSALTLLDGQYFRVMGSALNDGVWQYPATDMKDEHFSGAVWGLAIPPAVVALADEISTWQEKFGADSASPWQSESYSRGAYSRSKGSAADSSLNWRVVFADRLAPWRKI